MIDTLYEPFRTELTSVGTLYFYSDPHFEADEDLQLAFPNRPTAEEQVKMINAKVGKNDHIIFLGDIGSVEWVSKVRGHKWLICGNHDVGVSAYEDIFERVYSGPLVIAEKIILSHEPIDLPYFYNIHGHNHQGPHLYNRHCNVCADVIDYTPLNFNQFVKSGHLKEAENIHRLTINKATKNARKRGERKK